MSGLVLKKWVKILQLKVGFQDAGFWVQDSCTRECLAEERDLGFAVLMVAAWGLMLVV